MSLSYDAVAEVARTLESEGKSVGARAILDVLKTGSMTTIQKHLFRWREERARLAPPDLPESLHRAILGFAEAEVKKGQLHLERLLDEMRSALADVLRTGEEQEKRILVLEDELREREVRIGELSEQIRHLDVRMGECQERESREREEAHALREDLARATLRLEELPRLREETHDLRLKVEQEKEARTTAEKDSAVSRALLAEKAASHKPTGRA
ncbi:hypothetical protein B1A_20197 [mine drainage metagenome]|uniref:KfrA N-terminal DNA-binding domain-containing protein n=2 Tax=mine drainage metagenome TaxID=410659 RepID=T0YG84_9ZZZZ